MWSNDTRAEERIRPGSYLRPFANEVLAAAPDRNHPATEVYVTGTFDEWKKTEKLGKIGDSFEKQVALPDASSKIFYKFVVDGDWVIDHTAPKETDESGNENNVLTPEQIVSKTPPITAIMSSAAPDSTTAALAAEVPLEKKDETADEGETVVKDEKSGVPGAFPETPAAELNDEGVFGVNPLPAAPGAVNPITLAPGEKVPEGLAAESTVSNVKLDPESYEKSDELPGGVPVTISSAAPVATTAALVADVPIESKVPEVVKESQEKAHVDPEASAVPEEVEEKAAVEKELLDKVKEAPTTSEGTAGEGTEKTEDVVTPGEATAAVAASASAAAAAAVAGAVSAKDAAVDKTQDVVATAQTTAVSAATQLPDSVKEKLPESVQSAIDTTQKEEVREEVSPEVPAEVKESITEAEKSPEAAANTEAVEEKKVVETELLSEVKPVDSATNGEPREEVSSEIPVTVKESIVESGRSPEAATNTEVVEGKKAVETQLLDEVKPAETPGESAQQNAPATAEAPETKETPALAVPATTDAPATSVAAATTETPAVAAFEQNTETKETSDAPVAPVAIAATETPAVETSKPAEQKTTTNGAKAAVDPTTPAKPAEDTTPSSSKAGNSPATGEKKKKNRLSAMFGKVKAKLSHKN
ncbi:hypothetical protein EKO27_g7477 [Xylaria grammica]|uniref:AMP-activated protein kinase glycogen-binding domain-containing protein n=1 Tax=Xylaria grammica TaxID=363999 RepID=A0A439CZI7_9PEZI|nr:hypothetical protein EKO27_g7477 [Xylaria grammica]